jgi:hypothetical protein
MKSLARQTDGGWAADCNAAVPAAGYGGVPPPVAIGNPALPDPNVPFPFEDYAATFEDFYAPCPPCLWTT